MRKAIISGLVLGSLVGGMAAAPSLVFGQAAAPPATPPSRHAEHQRPLPSQLIDARLAYLKTALKITPAQESQWNALADVLRHQARERDADVPKFRADRERRGQTATPQPSAIERLERRQEFLAKASGRVNDVLTAAKPLYASFSPDQKQMADELLTHGHRFHHGR